MFGRIFPASAHSVSALIRDLAERGIFPHRLAGADAEHAGALDQQQIGACASPMPPVKPITSSRAPQAMQRTLFSNISPPTGSNTTSAPRPSVMRLTASRNGSRP